MSLSTRHGLLGFVLDFGDGALTDFRKCALARDLVGFLVSGSQRRAVFFFQDRLEFVLGRVPRCDVPRFLGCTFRQVDDRIDHRTHGFVTEADGAEHDLFAQLVSFRFDHQHALGGPRHHQVEFGIG